MVTFQEEDLTKKFALTQVYRKWRSREICLQYSKYFSMYRKVFDSWPCQLPISGSV